MSVATLAGAQQIGGSAIQGRVVDGQGGVLPGVSVVVTHQESGTFRETVSSVDGTYFVTGIPPGKYRVTAELAGFKKFAQEDVSLVLGRHRRVEIRLDLGGVTETITVTSAVPQVDLTTSQVGGNVASQEITDLPSPTRNFIAFVAMLPGVQLNPSAEGSDSLSINGQSNNQVNFVLDGGNNTDDNSASASGAQARTPLEAVQEFQVVTNQFDVEFGRTTGGVVNAITKRGIEQLPRFGVRLPDELGDDRSELLRQAGRTWKKARPTSTSTAARSAAPSFETRCTSSTVSNATSSAAPSPTPSRLDPIST